MGIDHKRPMYAFVAVALICGLVIVDQMRGDALISQVRHGVVAGTTLHAMPPAPTTETATNLDESGQAADAAADAAAAASSGSASSAADSSTDSGSGSAAPAQSQTGQAAQQDAPGVGSAPPVGGVVGAVSGGSLADLPTLEGNNVIDVVGGVLGHVGGGKGPDHAAGTPQATTVDDDLTEVPSQEPSEEPAEEPSEEPTEEPSEEPTEVPSEEPSEQPTEEPTEVPSEQPTEEPTEVPTEVPTEEPTELPSEVPVVDPLPTAWVHHYLPGGWSSIEHHASWNRGCLEQGWRHGWRGRHHDRGHGHDGCGRGRGDRRQPVRAGR